MAMMSFIPPISSGCTCTEAAVFCKGGTATDSKGKKIVNTSTIITSKVLS